MNGADLFVRELQKRGVPFIATLCGHGLDPLFKACRDANMRLIDVRNEQAAGYMADVTGRLTQQVGVCAVSSGVAHVNALTGVLNAHFDGSPMLLITGSGSMPTMGRGHFQDMDQIALAEPICKYAEVIRHAERISLYVHEAFSTALAGRPGPVHLTFPTDVQTTEIDKASLIHIPEPKTLPPANADPDALYRTMDLLADASNPLLIAGTGVYYAHGETALRHFTEAFPLPVVTPIWDRGSIPQSSDTFMGVIGAATGGPKLLDEADVILILGARCDYRVGYLQPPAIRSDAQLIRIDADPAELHQGIEPDLSIHGNLAAVLDQLSSEIKQRGLQSPANWLQETQSRRDAYREECRTHAPDAPLRALDIVDAIGTVLTDDTIFLIDGGNIGQWAHQLLCDRYPGHWLTCGASGVIGYGIPGAMAARAHHPDRPIILLSGDGSLTFTIAELESAARQGLNFVAVVADDEAWGIALAGHENQYGEPLASTLGPINYAQMAEAFGANGIRVNKADEITPAIQKALNSDKPTLIHVPIARSNPVE